MTRADPHFLLRVLAAAVAVVASVGATGAFVLGDGTGQLGIGVLLHVVAVVLSFLAAGGQARDERWLLAALTATLPVGGALAVWWRCVWWPARASTNAHAAAEVEREPAPGAERRAPPRCREPGVESAVSVVRTGDRSRRRALLRRLADLGEPERIALLRTFLAAGDPELRLCAHAELSRLGRDREHRIADLEAAVAAAPDDVTVWLELAAAQLAYAASGLLDPAMAEFWIERAERSGRRAVAADSDDAAARRRLAEVLTVRGRLDEASRCLAGDSDADLEAAAEIAFRRRRVAECRAAREQLRARDAEVPAWLDHAVAGGDRS